MVAMYYLFYLLLLIIDGQVYATVLAKAPNVFIKDLLMPGVSPSYDDEYLCSATTIEPKESYIVKYEVHSENNRAHHIMLFGCEDIDQRKLEKRYWKCSETNLCSNMKIMFAWAKNAPPMYLPKDVGFRIGGKSGVKHLVLQVHYAHAITENDTSGIILHTTYDRQKYIAGIFLLLSQSLKIPPLQPKFHGDVNCLYESKVPIYPFAYRVHAHELGRVVTGYTYNTKTKKWMLLGKGNPQWPQAFYPMNEISRIDGSDILVARCTFNSSSRSSWTFIGSTAADEMCNFYIMYYTDEKYGAPFRECIDTEYPGLSVLMPSDSDAPLPKNELLEEHALGHMGSHSQQVDKKGHAHHHEDSPEFDDFNAEYFYENKAHVGMKNENDQSLNKIYEHGPHRGKVHHSNNGATSSSEANKETGGGISDTLQVAQKSELTNLYKEVTAWPSASNQLGQVTAVSLDLKNNVVVFHRGKRNWNFDSFDIHNRFMHASDGFIQENTVVVYDQAEGLIVHEWGSNLFHMPHGLTVDGSGYVWVTDVALHQVFKFPPNGAKEPILTLGIALVPGSDEKHFCKPTSVAVTMSGDFFVADGYCNSRILKYSSNGNRLLEWGKKPTTFLGISLGTPTPYSLNIPHKLTLAEEKGLVCVADRENGRVQCFDMTNGTFHCQLNPPEFGGRVFAIDYTPIQDGLIYAVNGPAIYGNSDNVQGFVLSLKTQKLLGLIYPINNQTLSNPHDIAVTADASTVYITEIAPNKIWKFEAVLSNVLNMKLDDVNERLMSRQKLPTSTKMGAPSANMLHGNDINKAVLIGKESNTAESLSNYTPSMIIAALLAIPLLLMILITVFVRLHKQGKFYNLNLGHIKGWMSGYKQPTNDRFNLGNFLQRHKGFDRISMEESDGEVEGSDSDIEEYSASIPKA